MKKHIKFLLVQILLIGCIGTDIVDDFVEPKIVIENALISLKVGESYQYHFKYFDNIGDEEQASIEWTSSDPTIISIDNNGVVTAHQFGIVDITAKTETVSNNFILECGTETVEVIQERTAALSTTTSYKLSGIATLRKTNGALTLSFSSDFQADSALPGLYVYLSNSLSNISNAIEVSKITQFSGTQTLDVVGSTELFDYSYVFFYCKPFSVPVGSGILNP